MICSGLGKPSILFHFMLLPGREMFLLLAFNPVNVHSLFSCLYFLINSMAGRNLLEMSDVTFYSSVADFHSYTVLTRPCKSTKSALRQETSIFSCLKLFYVFLALRSLSSFLCAVSYEDTELLFEWKKDQGNKEVLVSEDLQIPQFILTNYWTEANFSNFTSGNLE